VALLVAVVTERPASVVWSVIALLVFAIWFGD